MEEKQTDSRYCTDCKYEFGHFSYRNTCQCGKILCSSCFDYAVVPPNMSGPDALIQSCKRCMLQMSAIDMSTNADICGPDDAPALLLVHGGGSSRGAWSVYLSRLQTHFKCYAIDMPRSGSKIDDALSMESACTWIKDFIDLNIPSKRVIYLGHSLGGYIGMRFVSVYPEYVLAAIFCSCTQRVGPGASVKAKLGMFFADALDGVISQKRILQAMYAAAGKLDRVSSEEWDACFFRLGSYFKNSREHLALMKVSDPTEELPKIRSAAIPVLFADGAKDHHDHYQQWVELANAEGRLYNSDHFFIMDRMVRDEFFNDIIEFARKNNLLRNIEQVKSS